MRILSSNADTRVFFPAWSISLVVLYPVGRGPRTSGTTFFRVSFDIKVGVKFTITPGKSDPDVEFVQHAADKVTSRALAPTLEVVLESRGQNIPPYQFGLDPYLPRMFVNFWERLTESANPFMNSDRRWPPS